RGSTDVVGRVVLLAGQSLAPGETGYVQIDFAEPVGALYGDRAVLRDHGARHTLAGGRGVDPFPPPGGRRGSRPAPPAPRPPIAGAPRRSRSSGRSRSGASVDAPVKSQRSRRS